MKNYEYEQNKNYESTKQMFEECRKDVGVSKGVKRAIPVVDDEICFSDIPENGVCITSQFENGLCGEIIWCRNGEDIYMLHSSIRLADHTVWLLPFIIIRKTDILWQYMKQRRTFLKGRMELEKGSLWQLAVNCPETKGLVSL